MYTMKTLKPAMELDAAIDVLSTSPIHGSHNDSSSSKPEDLKGVKDGNCNRTACQKPGATWFNHSTRKWYCPECAQTLNNDSYNKFDAYRLFGHELCTMDENR